MSMLEARIEEWRSAVTRSGSVDASDAEELEGHLRDEIVELAASGLSEDEAFLIAVGRLGRVDQLTAEFAREHSDRVWKQLTLTHDVARPRGSSIPVMLVFAFAAAVLVHLGRLLFGVDVDSAESAGVERYLRSVSLFVLPVAAGYFALVRRMPRLPLLVTAGVVAALATAVSLFPAGATSSMLIALHLPVVLWFVVGATYVAGEVGSHPKRMDFIRFTGEFVIYYALIALGGGVLLGLTALVLTPIAPELLTGLVEWVLPSGTAGAVIVAAWLVEAKKSIIENIAPVLTAIFTPLFAVMLVIAAIGYAGAGVGREFDRDLLIVFDVLLLVVLGLIVYGISARPPGARAGLLDVLRLVAIVAALALDVLVLVSMADRVGEFGLTPNRVAALGHNLLLLANLAVAVWHIARLLAGRAPALRLERWQTGYLPVFAAWVLFVALAVPPLFGFV